MSEHFSKNTNQRERESINSTKKKKEEMSTSALSQSYKDSKVCSLITKVGCSRPLLYHRFHMTHKGTAGHTLDVHGNENMFSNTPIAHTQIWATPTSAQIMENWRTWYLLPKNSEETGNQ